MTIPSSRLQGAQGDGASSYGGSGGKSVNCGGVSLFGFVLSRTYNCVLKHAIQLSLLGGSAQANRASGPCLSSVSMKMMSPS